MIEARKSLASIWFIAGGILFIILFIQTLLGTKFGVKVGEVWSWFLPTIMPTLSLIIGIFVSDAVNNSNKSKTVDRYLYRLSLILSIIYLLAVFSVFLITPLTYDPINSMKLSNYGLGPLQGIVSACLGVFFLNKEKSMK